MNILPIHSWGLPGNWGKPLLLAGPCSAETEMQVLESCAGAAQAGAQILRAGIWKPRTRPDSFQGVGAIGLPWIKRAGRLLNRPVMVEVASACHVEEALKAEVEVFWIGARSAANPFTIQEIANALRGVDIPIFIKNPVNPDLDLWIGALERFQQAGLKKMALIHRGFSVYKADPYRNAPMWQIPIEMKRRFPQLEIICDPSHITGDRNLVLRVAQKAYDLDFDGLMIETHCRPERAWSDAAQQVNGAGLKDIMQQLIRRAPDVDDPDFHTNLEALRYDIDRLDREIIDLLAKRMEVSQEIGKYKKDIGVTILQVNRWSEIFDSRVEATIEAGLSEAFAKEFIQSIHNESIRQQTKVMNE